MTAPASANTVGEAATPPASPTASSEFVIVDAPMPDHTASDDSTDTLSKRSADRTEVLKEFAEKRRPGRPRKETVAKPTKPVVAMPRGGYTKELEELYGGVAMFLMFRDPECAMAVMEAAPKCAESLNDLAAKNPAVRRIIAGLTQTSTWGAVIAAHAPILLAVGVHHVPAIANSPLAALVAKPAPEANAA